MKERLLKLYHKHIRMWENATDLYKRVHHSHMTHRIGAILYNRYEMVTVGGLVGALNELPKVEQDKVKKHMEELLAKS